MSLSAAKSGSASKFTGTETTERSSSVHLRISLEKCQFSPQTYLLIVTSSLRILFAGMLVQITN